MRTAGTLVLTLLYGLALGSPVDPSLSEDMESKKRGIECLAEAGITNGTVPNELKSEETILKFDTCMFKKDGTITMDGKFNSKILMDFANAKFKSDPKTLDVSLKTIDTCKDDIDKITDLTDEKLAKEIIRCLKAAGLARME